MSSVIKYNLVIENKESFHPLGHDNHKPNKSSNIVDFKEKEKEILDKARRQAEKIISDAKNKAELYLEEAYNKAKEIFDASKTKGYNEGYNEGFKEGKKIADELINEANDIKRDYINKSRKVLKEIEKDVIELVIRNCEEILNKKLDEDKEVITSIIIKGLNSLDIADNVTIKVAKDDYDIVELSKNRILSMASLVENINIKIDNKLEKGDCIIETEKGSVDVSVKSQVNEMKAVLYNLLNSE